MSKTKGAIMDIMDWYGYIPDNYTFKDYNDDIQKRQKHAAAQAGDSTTQDSQAIQGENPGCDTSK